MTHFLSLVEAVLAHHGQSVNDSTALQIGLDTEDGLMVLLSAVRLPDDRDGIEIWIPLDNEAPDRPDDPGDFWLMLHRLNHESRFAHDWRIAAGDDGRIGLCRRLPLEALDAETLAHRVDEGLDRVMQLRLVLSDSAVDAAAGHAAPEAPLGPTMIRG